MKKVQVLNKVFIVSFISMCLMRSMFLSASEQPCTQRATLSKFRPVTLDPKAVSSNSLPHIEDRTPSTQAAVPVTPLTARHDDGTPVDLSKSFRVENFDFKKVDQEVREVMNRSRRDSLHDVKVNLGCVQAIARENGEKTPFDLECALLYLLDSQAEGRNDIKHEEAVVFKEVCNLSKQALSQMKNQRNKEAGLNRRLELKK